MSRLSPELEEIVQARLRYYRDLGVYDFYRRGEPDAEALQWPAETLTPADDGVEKEQPRLDAPVPSPLNPSLDSEPVIPARKPVAPPPDLVPGIVPAARRGAALEAIRAEIGDCTRCPLAFQGRHKIVFADGDPNARLMFVGEGPGADEDAQGLPFVGRAGQLLNAMLRAIGLPREAVYIANTLKCRPPHNRDPQPNETGECFPFLERQIELLKPKIMLVVGRIAAHNLLRTDVSLSRLRQQVHLFGASRVPLIVTYHPAYLLRTPSDKRKAWEDLKFAREVLARG